MMLVELLDVLRKPDIIPTKAARNRKREFSNELRLRL